MKVYPVGKRGEYPIMCWLSRKDYDWLRRKRDEWEKVEGEFFTLTDILEETIRMVHQKDEL